MNRSTPRRRSIQHPLRLALPLGSALAAGALGIAAYTTRLLNGPAKRTFLDAVEPIAPRPVLLIHGAADSMIPVDHGRAIFAAAGEPKELWVVPGAEHCGAYFADRPYYVTRVAQFFDRHLGSLA